MQEKEKTRDASVAEVWNWLVDNVRPLEAGPASLAEASGRVLRQEVRADEDQPPFDRAAMDGYAFFPVAGAARYRITRVIKAGDAGGVAPAAGEALRIFTGAALPAQGMAVLMQEEAGLDGDKLLVNRAVAPGENVRPRGSDSCAGDILFKSGTKLGPTELALLASVGVVKPVVSRTTHVAHATTGDEIVPPEAIPNSGQIRNSNQVLLAALLADAGVPRENLHQEHWGDDPHHAAAQLVKEPFASADLVIISGGASVGDHDYTARILVERGFELPIRKVNSRPGRPLIVGRRESQLVFGLPGNPLSHFVCFHLFVRKALARLAGAPAPLWRKIPLAAPLLKSGNRRPSFWPAALQIDHQGKISAQALPWNNSGHLAALVGVQAMIAVPPDTAELPAGTLVDTLAVADVF